MGLFDKKSFESVKEVSSHSDLPKTMTAFDLVILGLAGIIGTGIFVLTGMVAAKYSGPAVMLSYIIAGVTCIFVALAYTELAAMLPTSGSVYTYAYVTFGEVVAWLMGGVIILEFAIASSTVAVAWSGYITHIMSSGGIHLPEMYTKVPSEGGIVNLPAVLIVAFIAFVLYLGTKESKKLNTFLVFVKMAAIGAFIVIATPHFEISNWSTFMPFGFYDVLTGSSILFFAFTGFGTLAAAAEECKNPKRDLTIGIIGALLIAMLVYVIVGGLATGIVPFAALDNAQPLAEALRLNGSHLGSIIVSVGAVFGMPTVIMANIYGISRIFYVIARDGLLPSVLTRLHPKHNSPYLSILIFSTAIALLAGFCPMAITAKMSSMGALIDYLVIMSVVMVLRIKMPDVPRPFKCPALFVVAPIGFCASAYLLSTQIISKDGSLMETGECLIYWFGAILALYFVNNCYRKR
jgi:APA family basic amino acid/polyamine antiporter